MRRAIYIAVLAAAGCAPPGEKPLGTPPIEIVGRPAAEVARPAPIPPPVRPSPRPAQTAGGLLTDIARRSEEFYKTALSRARLAEAAAKAFVTVDPGFTSVTLGDAVELRYRGKPVARLPVEDGGASWRGFAEAIDAAAAAAPSAAPEEETRLALAHAMARAIDPEASVFRYRRREGRSPVALGADWERLGEAVVLRAIHADGVASSDRLVPGDRILAVDGVPVARIDMARLKTLLDTPGETPVTLRVAYADGRRSQSIAMRGAAPSYRLRRDGAIVIAELWRIEEREAEKLRSPLLLQMVGQQTAGLVLDLRGSPGGLLDQVAAIADLFLREGAIAQLEGRTEPNQTRFAAAPGETLLETPPLVVLVNGATSSGAEAIAAALQDRGRAVIVGTRTQAIGTVRTLVPLASGLILGLPTAEMRRPAGPRLSDGPVVPDVCPTSCVPADGKPEGDVATAAVDRESDGVGPLGTGSRGLTGASMKRVLITGMSGTGKSAAGS